jgi:hypothetical protein
MPTTAWKTFEIVTQNNHKEGRYAYIFSSRCAAAHAPLAVSLVLLLVFSLAGGLIVPAHAEPLADSGATLPGLTNATTTWADYDTDGDLDLLLTGATTSDDRFIALYGNDSGTLTALSGTGLTGLSAAAVAWGDYDNDNDPDLLLAGTDATATRQTVLYRNNSDGTFTADSAATSAIPGLSGADADWGDYDNDGNLDLLLAGDADDGGVGAPLTEIYRNDGGTEWNLTNVGAPLPRIDDGVARWGDYDGDGDFDALLSGTDGVSTDTTRIYTNNGGAFALDSDATGDLPDVQQGVIAWADYDNDGDLDLFLGGTVSGTDDIARVYKNNNGRFAQSMRALPKNNAHAEHILKKRNSVLHYRNYHIH